MTYLPYAILAACTAFLVAYVVYCIATAVLDFIADWRTDSRTAEIARLTERVNALAAALAELETKTERRYHLHIDSMKANHAWTERMTAGTDARLMRLEKHNGFKVKLDTTRRLCGEGL